MRMTLIAFVLLAAPAATYGQVSARTGTFSFEKPVLNVKAGFLGENGNTYLGARESGTLTLSVINTGGNVAHLVTASLNPGPALRGLQFDLETRLGDIKPGETKTAKISILAPEEVKSQDGLIRVDVRSDPPLVSGEATVELSLRESPLAHLEVRLPVNVSTIPAGESVRITAQVRNSGNGPAGNVNAWVSPLVPGTQVSFDGRSQPVRLGTLEHGASKDLVVNLKTAAHPNQNAAAFVITLWEERRKSAVAETLSVSVKAAGSVAEEAAFAAFKRGDFIEAIRSFEKVVSLGKASAEVYFSLGVAYYRDRNPVRCLSNMQKSARLGSNDAARWLEENTYASERVTVSYMALTSDPFAGYAQPIGLGILGFRDSLDRETAVAARIYEVLKANNKSFRIFPYTTIKQEHASLNLGDLDASNRQVLGALEKDLSVNFVVTGTAGDSLGSSITLHLVRSKDATTVLTREFRSSTGSTALDDLALLLLKRQSPVYHTKQVVSVRMP